MSPNAQLDLKTKGGGVGATYTILPSSSNVFAENVISVDKNGNIRSSESTGSAVVLVSSHGIPGAALQSFSVLIEVRRLKVSLLDSLVII